MTQKLSILVVDDDADDREVFGDVMQEIDPAINCIFAANGEDALNVLGECRNKLPAYIFLDLNMPRMNGRQCLEAMKNIDAFRDIPVIILSTSSMEKEIRETLALGAVGFITKPNNLSDLKKKIEGVLKTADNSR
ncbi:MAG: response regulator [Taibaiella sp.]|nr:response regulator [Taibaiella sp.]